MSNPGIFTLGENIILEQEINERYPANKYNLCSKQINSLDLSQLSNLQSDTQSESEDEIDYFQQLNYTLINENESLKGINNDQTIVINNLRNENYTLQQQILNFKISIVNLENNYIFV